MWFAVLALAGIAAAETQCECSDSQLYNPEARLCVTTAQEMPINWTGSDFIFDFFEYQTCPNKPQWAAHFSTGYESVRIDDQCSCISSGAVNLNTVAGSLTGFTWDYSTQTCRNLMTPGGASSNEIDVKECAFKLVNNFPGSFSHCGTLNMCHCAQMHRFVADAMLVNPDHNTTDNALNMHGDSTVQCGWDFLTSSCVPQEAQYSGSRLFVTRQIRTANALCTALGYYLDQPGRVEEVVSERYEPPPYVSPNIAICAGKNASKCTCSEDPRCFMDSNLDCVPYMVDGIEVNRTAQNVTMELLTELCGDTYCNTFTTACDCYETPHSNGTCGWDGSTCDSTTVTLMDDVYEAHCCDAFKTPCECKVGRLPWSGYADFVNTCGWDHAEGVCRLSAITTNAEMINHGCAESGDCVLVDLEADCDLNACDWLVGRHSCVPTSNE